jgi:hypothetical protein
MADLVSAVDALGCVGNPEMVALVVRSLRLAPRQKPGGHVPERPESSVPHPPAVVMPAPAVAPEPPLAGRSDTAGKGARHGTRVVPFEPGTPRRPGAAPIQLDALARYPGVPHEPLLRPRQGRAAMTALTSMRRPGHRLDMPTLVRRLARCRRVSSLPYAVTVRPARSMIVLADLGDGMEPYRADVDDLIGWIRAAAQGRVPGVRWHTFIDNPLHGIDPDPETGELRPVFPWRRPAPDTLVIVVTDLGAPPRADTLVAAREAWWDVALRVAGAQAVLVALTPVPRREHPRWLAGAMEVVCWDDLHRTARLGA